MNAVVTFFQNFLAHPQWDLVLVAGFMVGYVLYSFLFARFRMMVATVAIYAAYTVVAVTPFLTHWIQEGDIVTQSVKACVAFLLLFLLSAWLLERSSLGDAMVGSGSYVSVAILAVLQAGLLVSLILSLLPANATSAWASPVVELVFLKDVAKSLWVISSVAILAAFGRGLV